LSKQLSQQDVAERINFDRTTISRIERGKRHLKVSHMSQFSAVYDVEVTALFELDGDRFDYF
jgi:transcriptional regulator with XRE-family HTH domain